MYFLFLSLSYTLVHTHTHTQVHTHIHAHLEEVMKVSMKTEELLTDIHSTQHAHIWGKKTKVIVTTNVQSLL